MYDFSKGEGETINFGKNPLMGGNYYCPTFECVNIKNIQTIENPVLYKEDSIMNVYAFGDWIKRIGSLSGLYYTEYRALSGPFGAYGAQLICMKEQGDIKYLKENCTSCFNTPHGLSIKEGTNREFTQVRYNLSNKTIELSTKAINLPYTFRLLDLEGKELMSYTITETNTNINLSGLLSGVYIYSLSGENVKQTGKIVVK
jgi:hypothetical protein